MSRNAWKAGLHSCRGRSFCSRNRSQLLGKFSERRCGFTLGESIVGGAFIALCSDVRVESMTEVPTLATRKCDGEACHRDRAFSQTPTISEILRNARILETRLRRIVQLLGFRTTLRTGGPLRPVGVLELNTINTQQNNNCAEISRADNT